MKKIFNNILSKLTNYRLIENGYYKNLTNSFHQEPHLDKDFLKAFRKLSKIYKKNIIEETNYTAFTMTKNVINLGLKGSFVECGVYKGEKISYILEALNLMNDFTRDIYVVDTFAGMTESSKKDFQVISGVRMSKGNMYSNLEKVKKNIFKSKYPKNKIKFIEMDVRDQKKLKKEINTKISFLRIDTDFYDSVSSILNTLYDNVVCNGFVIHDDYGHWKGHYEACIDFYKKKNINPSLIRTCRKERIEIKK